jgi:exonuclease SbcD
MRFIHCADIHLDSPLRGLNLYEGAPAQEMRLATRRAFTNVVDLAIDRSVDFVLIAGDIFDGDWPDFNTGLYFSSQLRRLGEAGIRVFLTYGNHDAVSKLTKSVPLPQNVFVFPAKAPGTEMIESLGVAIHGQSFASEAVTADLSAGYPAPLSGLLNIGVLHTALSGREGHLPYAPTTAERLTDKGYDYWALGHVHKREIVRESPWIVFPGNTQGRHARETGAKGCMVVDAEPGVGIQTVEFVPTDIARWHHISIDIAGISTEDELHAEVQTEVRAAQATADDRILALRLTLAGRGPLHPAIVSNREAIRAQLCASISEASAGNAWLEKVRIKISAPLDLPRLALRDDPIGLLIRSIETLGSDSEALHALAASVLGDLGQKLPAELLGPDSAWALDSKDALAEVLANSKERLLAAIAAEDTLGGYADAAGPDAKLYSCQHDPAKPEQQPQSVGRHRVSRTNLHQKPRHRVRDHRPSLRRRQPAAPQ